MGSAMAANLIKAGFEVHGFDPIKKALKALQKVGGQDHADAQSVAKGTQVVITSLSNAFAWMATAKALSSKKNKGLSIRKVKGVKNDP